MFNIENLTQKLIEVGHLPVEIPLQGRAMITHEIITTDNVDSIAEQLAAELTKQGIVGELEYHPDTEKLVLNRIIQ